MNFKRLKYAGTDLMGMTVYINPKSPFYMFCGLTSYSGQMGKVVRVRSKTLIDVEISRDNWGLESSGLATLNLDKMSVFVDLEKEGATRSVLNQKRGECANATISK